MTNDNAETIRKRALEDAIKIAEDYGHALLRAPLYARGPGDREGEISRSSSQAAFVIAQEIRRRLMKEGWTFSGIRVVETDYGPLKIGQSHLYDGC